MAAILDFRSCDIWEHFYVHRWIDHTPKHGIRHQHQLSRLNNTKVMRVFNFGYFGWRPYWIWPKKVPSRFFPPGILIDLVNRPPKENNYVGFKTIPIFSRSNSIFMRLMLNHVSKRGPWLFSIFHNHEMYYRCSVLLRQQQFSAKDEKSIICSSYHEILPIRQNTRHVKCTGLELKYNRVKVRYSQWSLVRMIESPKGHRYKW